MFMYKKLNYFCHKTIENGSKRKYLQSLTHNKFEKSIWITHIIQNPDFFDLDSIFNEQITNHNKIIETYLVKNDFTLVFNKECTPHFPSEKQNLITFQLKSFLFFWIDHMTLTEWRYKFFQVTEMCSTIVSSIRYISYEFYIERPMQLDDWNLIMINDENPRLMKALVTTGNHLSIRKNSVILCLKPVFFLKRFSVFPSNNFFSFLYFNMLFFNCLLFFLVLLDITAVN